MVGFRVIKRSSGLLPISYPILSLGRTTALIRDSKRGFWVDRYTRPSGPQTLLPYPTPLSFLQKSTNVHRKKTPKQEAKLCLLLAQALPGDTELDQKSKASHQTQHGTDRERRVNSFQVYHSLDNRTWRIVSDFGRGGFHPW
jgi:hypothetical protein